MLLGGGQVACAGGISQVVRPLRGDRSTAPMGPGDRLAFPMGRRPSVGGLFEVLIATGIAMIGALCRSRGRRGRRRVRLKHSMSHACQVLPVTAWH